MKIKLLIVGLVSLLSIILIVSCSSVPAAPVANPQPPAAQPTTQQATDSQPVTRQASAALASPDGNSLVQDRCTKCHSLGRVQSAKKDEAGWKTTVDRMVGKGAQLSAEEQAAAIKYLAATYK